MNAPQPNGEIASLYPHGLQSRACGDWPATPEAGERGIPAGQERGEPACPVCAGGARPAFRAADYRMYRCVRCRLAFVFPQPSAEELSRFYSRFHEDARQGGYYDARVEGRARADFAAKSALVRGHLRRPKARLLDIGCGKGYFVKVCRDQGIEAEGIDVSASAVRFASEVLGVPVTCGRLEERTETLGRFDAATLWATIEHLPDPIATLDAVRRVLVPGGYLFLDTGVGDDWLDRLLPGVAQWYDPPQHLFVFSIAGMRNCLEAAGFEVVRLDPCFERSRFRKRARMARAFFLAAGLRIWATLGKMSPGPEPFTRFPLGNLMNVIARRPGGRP
jgi:SAM-dependent methyltransferase